MTTSAPLRPMREILAPLFDLRTAVRTRTGRVRETCRSNDQLHRYEGAVLGMRQRILQYAREANAVLPPNFENFAPTMVLSVFRDMAANGYFPERQLRETFGRRTSSAPPVRESLRGTPLDAPTRRAFLALDREYGPALAERLFTLSHVQTRTRWVPLSDYAEYEA